MSDDLITYFGYGSLVNRITRPAAETAKKASLTGWQRVWGHRVHNDGARGRCTSLTIKPRLESVTATLPSPEDVMATSIDGVLVTLHRRDLPALDEREAGYDRHLLPISAFVAPDEVLDSVNGDGIYVYVSDNQHCFDADADHPVLQSYVDCVLAGFLDLFGERGLLAFMDTTRGWDRPIDNDRNNPRYPRAVNLSLQQQQQFDALLSKYR